MFIKTIQQIEISSRCNLRCSYCVHGNDKAMTRVKLDMGEGTWRAALRWVEHFVRQGTQGELNLAGVGESTLHPRFPGMIAEARAVVGPYRDIIFATNGILVTPALIEAIKPFQPKVWVSTHQPARAAHAIQGLKDAGLIAGISMDGALNPNDWAGQVDWIKPSYRFPCPWLTSGHGFVAASGAILTCCLDVTAGSALEDVSALPRSDVKTQPWHLCKSCYQDVPVLIPER
ncbi:MAG: radical SAM protein [Sphingomonas sp.]|jgi:hypothetical protein|uniref:radical SAM protein n=1 Tax=Sphingomonas sp. TaxID=28214 RepID=UPI0035652DF3